MTDEPKLIEAQQLASARRAMTGYRKVADVLSADLTSAQAERDEARRERDRVLAEWTIARERMITAERERDEARAQVVACQTVAADLRAVARDVITDCAARFCVNPATCACSMARMIRLMAPERAGTDPVSDSSASVAPSATPDLLGPQIGAES